MFFFPHFGLKYDPDMLYRLLIKSAGFIKAAWDLYSPPDSQQHSDKTDYSNPAGGIWLSCMIYLSLSGRRCITLLRTVTISVFLLWWAPGPVWTSGTSGAAAHCTTRLRPTPTAGEWHKHIVIHHTGNGRSSQAHSPLCVYIMCSSCTYCVSKCSRSSGFFRHTENVFVVHRYCILLSFTNMN